MLLNAVLAIIRLPTNSAMRRVRRLVELHRDWNFFHLHPTTMRLRRAGYHRLRRDLTFGNARLKILLSDRTNGFLAAGKNLVVNSTNPLPWNCSLIIFRIR